MSVNDLPGPHERAAAAQRILNERPIPDRARQRVDRPPIDVVVRLEWELDGVEHVNTIAFDWVDRDVLVGIRDRRWQTHGVWLDAGDVQRR